MHLPASHNSNDLPKKFPIGTTYVVEGRGGEAGELHVSSRYVVLPGGQRINLVDDPKGKVVRQASPRTRRPRQARGGSRTGRKIPSVRAKKIPAGAGTPRQRHR